MSSVASPLGPESPFPCLRGGALFDTLRRRHDGRLPVLHVTTCPGHVAVRFRLNAQSTRQKESTVCRVTSISLGSTEHGLGRDCIVTLLFDSGHGRRWAMPSTRNLHAFIDNICTEDDEKFCNASDSLRSKRDVDSQLDSPLLAVPYASENVLLEVFQGEPWMPHLKTLNFLAVDGGGFARLHSFSGGSWRLDCTFSLLPSAASYACISGNMAYWVEAGVGVLARPFSITSDGKGRSKMAAADDSSSDSDDNEETIWNENTNVSLGLTSTKLPAPHVMALFPCRDGIFTLYADPDVASSASHAPNGVAPVDLEGARLWACLDRQGYPRASIAMPWRYRKPETPPNTIHEVGTGITAWLDLDGESPTVELAAAAHEEQNQASVPVQLFWSCRPATAELVVLEMTVNKCANSSGADWTDTEVSAQSTKASNTTGVPLLSDTLPRNPRLLAFGISSKGSSSNTSGTLAYRSLCALTNFWNPSASERSIPVSVAVYRHFVLILSADNGRSKGGDSSSSNSSSNSSSSNMSSSSRQSNEIQDTDHHGLDTNSDRDIVNWHLEAFDLRAGMRLGSQSLVLSDAQDLKSTNRSQPYQNSPMPRFWVPQCYPAPPSVVTGVTIPGVDAATLHVTRFTSLSQGEPHSLANAMASARCAASCPGLGATSYGANATAMTLAKVALEAGTDPVRALHQAGFRGPGALPPAAVKALLAMATGSTCPTTTTTTTKSLSARKPRMPRCLLERRFREAGWLPELSEPDADSSAETVNHNHGDAHASAEADGFGSAYDGSGSAERSSLGLRCRAALGTRHRFMHRANNAASPPPSSVTQRSSRASPISDLQQQLQSHATSTETSYDQDYASGTLESVLMNDAVAFLGAVQQLEQHQKKHQPSSQHMDTEEATRTHKSEPPLSPEGTLISTVDALRICLDGFVRYRPSANTSESTGLCSDRITSENAMLQGIEETFEVTCRVLFTSKPKMLPPFVAALQRGPSALSTLPVSPQQHPRDSTTGYATRALACLDRRVNDEEQVQALSGILQMASLPER